MYNNQLQIDRLTSLKNDIENQLAQLSAQPMIQQNFLTPGFQSEFDSKWVENKEQVKNIQVTRDSIFMDKSNAIFYLKTPSGEIKTYEFTEYIEKDPKDEEIEKLKEKIKELERGAENESVNESNENRFEQPVINVAKV